MKKEEIKIDNVGDFTHFAKTSVSLLFEILKCLLNRKDSMQTMSINGRTVFHSTHLMTLLGCSERKLRQLRSDDEIEYMISKDGRSIIYYDSHVEEYLANTFMSSRTAEAKANKKLRNERFNNLM